MAGNLDWPMELNFLAETARSKLKKVNKDPADGTAPEKKSPSEKPGNNLNKKTQDEKIDGNIYDNRYEVLEKKDFIEKWLMTNKQRVRDGTNSPSPSGSSSHSCIPPTPPEKRTPCSPLNQITQAKRQRTGKLKSRILFKNNNNEEQVINNERRMEGKKKDLFAQKENANLSLDLFSIKTSESQNKSLNSSTIKSPNSRLAACRAALMMTKRINCTLENPANSRRIITNKFEIENNNSPVSSSKQNDKISDSSSPRRRPSVESSPGGPRYKIDTESSGEEEDNASAILIESDSEVSTAAEEVIDDSSPQKVTKKTTHPKKGILQQKRNKTLNLKLPKNKLIDNFNKFHFQFIEEPEENIEDDDSNDADKTLCDIETSEDELSKKSPVKNSRKIIKPPVDDKIEDPDENEYSSVNEKTLCDESIDHSEDDEPQKMIKKRSSFEIIDDLTDEDQQPLDKTELDKIEEDYSQSDSDKTYWSEEREEKKDKQESSQKISQCTPSVTSVNIEGSSISDDRNVSFNTSSSRPSDVDVYPPIPPVIKKRRKAKKGTLLERLRNLVNSEISFLRIWRHQMSQAKYRGVSSQCIMIKIKKVSHSYGRQIFYGPVISDSYNLLNTMIKKTDPISDDDNSKCMITVITVPEIVGTVKIERKSILRIYPPWEVYDRNDLVLSCLHFNVIADKNEDDDQEAWDDNQGRDERVVRNFDCPCIRAKQLVHSCNVKFTNVKPNVIQYLFDH